MAPFLLGSQQRARVLGMAIFLTFIIWYLGSQGPDVAPTFQGGDAPGTAPGAAIPASQLPVPDPPDPVGGKQDDAPLAEPAKSTPPPECVSFDTLQRNKPEPKSAGKRKFPYVRPPPECRTFNLPAMEEKLEELKKVIKDPDLFRLLENSYPNTLDTMVKWRGFANGTDEELTYVITGDIDAMWLRDSASQIYSYLPFLEASTSKDSLASLWRGMINSHSRYVVISPYCHSFQPPPESGIPPTHNGAYSQNNPNPPYNPQLVFDCKWELDSLASFLQISAAYYERTGDYKFFGKYQWIEAVTAAVKAASAMRTGTYSESGKVLPSAWTFTGWTNRGSETLTNDGLGNPVKENGMVRTGFRPSDDACIFQLLVPANMMFAVYLEDASHIMEKLADTNETAANLTVAMRELASGIRAGIERDAIVSHRDFGDIFAYEVDGYGSSNMMDDANVPSLLAMPLWNYTRGALVDPPKKYQTKSKTKTPDYAVIYRNTRKFILSDANPYFSKGPVLSAVGGPHLGPGRGWPMAATVAALTAFEGISGLTDNRTALDEVVMEQLGMILDSTAGTGVVHETVDGFNENNWTRSWFGWANGLFGELILKIAREEKSLGASDGERLLDKTW
ncbi:DUF1237-domain-containing protein [Thozetella sp. PMI_491]|nr:DUF1237-domain-containing protein [Thozetella sp. PMI_491]